MMKIIDKRACRKFADMQFSINSNNGLLYLDNVKYIVYATVRNISEKRLLILYFCAVSAVQNGKLTPQYIVFQAHDDFITLEYCENGKSKWRQAKTKALGKDCHSFYTECAFYNHAEELKVIRFCGNSQKEKGFNTLEQLQENLACKREQSRKRAKEAKIKERMKPVNPLPERSLKKWLQKEIFPAHIFYRYYKGRKIQNGYCTHCHQEVEVHSPRHGKESVCPSCGWTATCHALGRKSYVFDRTTALYLQKHGEELLVRICKASVSYNDPYKPKIFVWESARFFISAYNRKFHCEHYYYSYSAEKLTPWTKGLRPCFNRWCYYFEADTCGHIYTQNLAKALKGTPWQYSQLKDYYQSHREAMAITPFLREYLSHPALEYLIKLRLFNLATFVVYGDSDYSLSGNPLNMDGQNIKEVLGVGKQYLPIMQELNIDKTTFWLMKQLLKRSLPADIQLLKWCQANRIHDADELERCLKYISVYKLMRYLQEQSTDDAFAVKQYRRDTPIKQAFDEYKDYVQFCEDLEYDLTDDFILFPRHLKEAHNRAAAMFDKKKVEIYNKKIAAEYENLVEQYQMIKYGFMILPPKTASEIVEEGHALHHCVGGYVSRVANKECVILFLRDAEKPDIPFYTIELKNGKVVQIRGENNCDPPSNVQLYIKAWKRMKLLPAASVQQAA